MNKGVRSWVPEVGRACGVGDNTRKDLLGASEAPRLPANSREPSQQMRSL